MTTSSFLFLIAVAAVLIILGSRKPKTFIFPRYWHESLIENVLFYQRLDDVQRGIFQQKMMRFLREVRITGVDTSVGDFDKILIVASAVISVFGFEDWPYSSRYEILLYPESIPGENEVLQIDADINMQQVRPTFQHSLILSRSALRQGFSQNLDNNRAQIPAFVNLLSYSKDQQVPEGLLDKQYVIPWLKIMYDEIEAATHDELITEQKFYEIAAEYFFEKPELLSLDFPKLYEILFQGKRI